jgi:hypothetical protein
MNDNINMDSAITGSVNTRTNVVNWLQARKVDYVGHMDSTITGSVIDTIT